ncbi:MAG: histidine kinase [Taibaiella sp.]|nr:histidine kinase [Taibaiella sp.]
MASAHKNIHWYIILLILAVFSLHLYLIHHVSLISWNPAIKDAALSTSFIALGVWSILLLINGYPTRVAILAYAILIAIFFTSAIIISDWQVLKLWLANNNIYYKWLHNTMQLRILLYCMLNMWIATIAASRKKIISLEQKYKQNTDTSVLLREAELYKLRQQLQPHFLYNSLNSISALVMIQPDKAQEMIGKLSDFLRSSVRKEAQEKIPIKEELEYIGSYLAIESIRFGDRLQIIFEKEYTDDAVIPPFLLQPILENAIKYGLYGKTGAVTINIHIALVASYLIVRVENPYDPVSISPRGTGFGLQGIQRRLYLLYARTDLLETIREEDTFITILKIPQAHV